MAKSMESKTGRRNRFGFSECVARALSGLWSNKYWVLFALLSAIIVFSWNSAKKGEKSASATLTLRYEQAYEGLNPNGTRFSIYDLLNDTVLENAIDRSGLTGEVSPRQLLQCLSVSPSGSQVAQNMYIATEYSVKLSDGCLPSRISAESMLRLLMETCKQYFLENYGTNDSALDIDWSDVDKWEYIEFANIMDVKVNNLTTYLNELRSESGMSQYRISGETFRSLSESIANFREIYLDRYTSFVTVNHLFRHSSDYSGKVNYRRFLTEQEKKSSQDRFSIYQDALKMYDESMITFVMVPMYDSDNGLYMARTSIGMDSLTENAKACAEQLEMDEKTIKAFDRELQGAALSRSDEAKLALAEKMIDDIKEHLDGLIARIRLVKRDYENYRSLNSIHYSIKQPDMMAGYNVKGSLLVGMGVLALFAVYYGLRKQSKRGQTL